MLDINLGLILASFINFFILFAILKHFFFDKVKAILDEREEYINEQIDNAEEATNKARMLTIENERIFKKTKQESKKLIEENKRKAEKIYEEIVSDAKEEASAIVERAKIEIHREREKVEYQLKKEAIDLALELSSKVIEKNIDKEKNSELIEQFITEVGN